MIRAIIEKLGLAEVFCPEARDLAKKLGTSSGKVTIKRQDGEEFTVDSTSSVIGGWIAGTNKNGKSVDINLCGKHYFKIRK